ncbi:MAG: putative pyridoxal-dependent aspartate 1-decarboxylase [Deltaproteobacteria bacterium]|nr:MAG: putative pyridoxal-dependent aspartate 1-decarboxylase [Deltaproteobacteria bacterium]
MEKDLIDSCMESEWGKLVHKFICYETKADQEKLFVYMRQILFGLQDFLNEHLGVTEAIDLKKLALSYTDTIISEKPEKKLTEVISEIINEVAPHAVNVSSPYFVGHMTAAIPSFMILLKALVAALNQNVVKLETSKVVSVIERQITAKIHRLIYKFDEDFYNKNVQSVDTSLGCFTEGGTSANITALWVARNMAFGPYDDFEGIEREGLFEAYRSYGKKRAVVLVSQRGHYSLGKAGGVLGIGNENIIKVASDCDGTILIEDLKEKIREFSGDSETRIIAVVGVAGTTETGHIDPISEMAAICKENNIHFHVDAAWGGPTLTSEKYAHFLDGIDLADSVTIDGHKQFYMPMTCGMVFFKNPRAMDAIAYHANYIIRKGSVDLGIKSLSGSKESNSLILHGAFELLGKKGYGMLIDHGIELAAEFAEEIRKRENFQLVTSPKLNILTYRYCPTRIKQKLLSKTGEERKKIQDKLNNINIIIQRTQREQGKSFVSRTALKRKEDSEEIVVLRAVLMNPLTNIEILKEVLDEQESIFRDFCNELI